MFDLLSYFILDVLYSSPHCEKIGDSLPSINKPISGFSQPGIPGKGGIHRDYGLPHGGEQAFVYDDAVDVVPGRGAGVVEKGLQAFYDVHGEASPGVAEVCVSAIKTVHF
jgi:hypothetical protein